MSKIYMVHVTVVVKGAMKFEDLLSVKNIRMSLRLANWS